MREKEPKDKNMEMEWESRPELLGILVRPSFEAFTHRIGDLCHRIATRTPRAGMLIRLKPETHLRAVPPLLWLGRKIAFVVDDEDDIRRAVARIIIVGGAHLRDEETAVYDDGRWFSATLFNLASLYDNVR